jgi:putative transcriptional regulator
MPPRGGGRGHDSGVPDDDRAGERPVSDGVDLTAALLVASPRLEDPNFNRTVVLVLDHGDEGALGVVLNRPTGLDVDEILEPWQGQAEQAPPAHVFRGGPVSPDAVIGLARAAGAWGPETTWRPVVGPVGTVDLGVSPDDQPVALAGVRLFAGYAGWDRGQLEAEIDEGGWFVVDVLADDVFSASPEHLWHDILRRQGGELRLLASYPPHPSLN